MKNSRRSFLSSLLGLIFLCSFSFCQEKKPEDFAKEIIGGVEKTIGEIKEGRFVLISFVNGSVEIISTVKPANEWNDEYKKSLEAKVVLTIKRGGTMFQLLQLKEKAKTLV